MGIGSAIKHILLGYPRDQQGKSESPSISKLEGLNPDQPKGPFPGSKLAELVNPKPSPGEISGVSKLKPLSSEPTLTPGQISGVSKIKPPSNEHLSTAGQISGVSKIRPQSPSTSQQPSTSQNPTFRNFSEDKTAWKDSRQLAGFLKANPGDDNTRRAIFQMKEAHIAQADLAAARGNQHLSDCNRKYADACDLAVNGQHDIAAKTFGNAKLKEDALTRNQDLGKGGPTTPENDSPELD